jgi:hypothetical protein
MAVVETFEERLGRNINLALAEGDLYFQRQGSVWQSLRSLAQLLDQCEVPYLVVGALSIFHHGYRRFTHNVNVVISDEASHRLDGHLSSQYYRPNSISRRFIDLQSGVSTFFSCEGDPPGGIEWRSVRIPSPTLHFEVEERIRFANLPTLISLKLASGLSNPRRLRDIADVQEMIKELCLVESFAEKLHKDVRDEFVTMCREIDAGAGPYLLLWDISCPSRPESFDELLAMSGARAAELKSMQRDGIRLFESRPYYENHAVLVTNDRTIARKYDMHHESEYLFTD